MGVEPRLHRDPYTGRRSVIAPDRAHRPFGGEAEDCPFCPGQERETPPELAAVGAPGRTADQPGWELRAFPNKYPAWLPGPDAGSMPAGPARGTHEVLVEAAQHDADPAAWTLAGWERVLAFWQERVRAAWEDPGASAVILFKNQGAEAGATLDHPHSQLMSLPFIPDGFPKQDPCGLCHLAAPAMVHSGDAHVVVAAHAPQAPYETWVVPRSHRGAFHLESPAERSALARTLYALLRAQRAVVGDRAYNWVLHTGRDAAGRHWRLEWIPRTARWGGFERATGHAIVEAGPEETAMRLRAVWGAA